MIIFDEMIVRNSLTKKRYKELNDALDKIKESYDAFYIENKYGTNTHKKEFELLETESRGYTYENALNWIKYNYDCYYKDEFKDEENTAFGYIRNQIKENYGK